MEAVARTTGRVVVPACPARPVGGDVLRDGKAVGAGDSARARALSPAPARLDAAAGEACKPAPAAGGDSVRPVRARKEDKRARRSKAAIRSSLLSLLEECDFDKVSVTAVARKAGVDRKTFYKHYGSVDEVFDDAVRERALAIAEALSRQTARLNRRMDVTEMFQLLSYVLVKEAWLTDRALTQMPSDLLLDKVEDPLIRVFTEQVILGLSAQMGQNAEYGVAFFVGGLLASFRRWLAADSELPLEQLSSAVGAAVASGLEGIARP